MVHHLLQDNGHGLTIILVILYGQKFMIDPMVVMVADAPCWNKGHG
jgi:hypothetical protein